MEQITWVGVGELERRDVPEPALQGDGEAIVRPLAVATCDLDALIVRGRSPFQPPLAIGHECVAEVVDAGDSVEAARPGTRVTVPFQISCGECESCAAGRSGNCTGVQPYSTYGFGPAAEEFGGFLSELVRVPYADHMLVPVPESVDSAAVASSSDNIPDGWRAVGPPLEERPGAPVLVVGGGGPGSIGLYAAACAVALGSERVVYVDRDEGRRAVAAEAGAEALDFPDEPLGWFPITVDASADPAGLTLALRSCGPDGICTSTGIYFGEQGPPMPLFEMYAKNTTFHTGRVHARPAIPPVLELAASGRLQPEIVTTREVPWAEATDALVERGWTKLVVTR